VQGQLRQEKLSFLVESECGHCRAPLCFEIERDLSYRVLDGDAEPLVYAPLVDFDRLEDPSIIDAF
jgi:hypothetical protein